MNLVDSCGWLEYFADGPNADFFSRPIEDHEHLLVPTICLYEVFRRTLEQRGRNCALEAVGAMRRGAVIALSDAIALDAAKLGLDLKLPLADSVILATAHAHKATLWTQDAHFDGIAGVRFKVKINR